MFGGRPFGTWQSILDATGLSAYMDPMDVRRILANPREYQKQLDAAAKDRGPLGIADKTAKTWQDMNRQVELAEGAIFSTFVKGMVPVAKSFSDLAANAAKASASLGSLADKIAAVIGGKVSPQEKKLLATAPAGTRTVNPLGGASSPGFFGALKADWDYLFDKPILHKPLVANGALSLTGKPMTDLLSLVRQDETRGRSGMEHAVSPAGAIGLYQIMPGTAAQYGRDPSKLQDVAYNEQTARIILAALVKRYHGNLDQVLAAYHSGPGAADTMRLGPAGREYLAYAHKQNNFRQVQIEISKAPGADVNVSVHQAPTWPNSAMAFSPGG
jgi:hypothetical protein